MSNDVTDTATLAVNGLSKLPILLKTNLQVSEGEPNTTM